MDLSLDAPYRQIIPEFIGLYDVGQKQKSLPSNLLSRYLQSKKYRH
jgi:hypothetical protein